MGDREPTDLLRGKRLEYCSDALLHLLVEHVVFLGGYLDDFAGVFDSIEVLVLVLTL